MSSDTTTTATGRSWPLPFPDEVLPPSATCVSSVTSSYEKLWFVHECGNCDALSGPYFEPVKDIFSNTVRCPEFGHRHDEFWDDYEIARRVDDGNGDCEACFHVIFKKSLACWSCGDLYWGKGAAECRGCKYRVDSSWVKEFSAWRMEFITGATRNGKPDMLKTGIPGMGNIRGKSAEEVAEIYLDMDIKWESGWRDVWMTKKGFRGM